MGLFQSLCFCSRDDGVFSKLDAGVASKSNAAHVNVLPQPQCSDCGKTYNKTRMSCYRCKHQFSVFQKCQGIVCSNVIIPTACPRCDSNQTISLLVF